MQVLEDFKPTWLLVTLASEDRLCEGRGDCEVGAEDACAGAWFFVFLLRLYGVLCLFTLSLAKRSI